MPISTEVGQIQSHASILNGLLKRNRANIARTKRNGLWKGAMG